MKTIYIFICISILYTQYAQSEVSQNFNNCKQFFYQNSPPFLNGLVNSKHICQLYMNTASPQFATSYDTKNLIPHYSAYKIENFGGPGRRHNGWFIEPQLSSSQAVPYMLPWNKNEESLYKTAQAVNSDYSGSGYDRGHLNPSMYHCENNVCRASTNTLTNVAPQAHSFNNNEWNKLETNLHEISKTHCNFDGANRYFITGVIPSSGKYLHERTSRVNIPDFYWTAVCCDSSKATSPNDRNEGWSVGFIAANKDNTTVSIYHIQDFLSSKAPKLFKDYTDTSGKTVKNCLFNPTKAEKIIDEIAKADEKFVKQTVKPSYFQQACSAAYSVYCYIRNLFG